MALGSRKPLAGPRGVSSLSSRAACGEQWSGSLRGPQASGVQTPASQGALPAAAGLVPRQPGATEGANRSPSTPGSPGPQVREEGAELISGDGGRTLVWLGEGLQSWKCRAGAPPRLKGSGRRRPALLWGLRSHGAADTWSGLVLFLKLWLKPVFHMM